MSLDSALIIWQKGQMNLYTNEFTPVLHTQIQNQRGNSSHQPSRLKITLTFSCPFKLKLELYLYSANYPNVSQS